MQSYLLDFNSKLSYTPNSPIPTTQSIKLPSPPHPTPNTTLLLTPWLYWSPPSTQYSHWPPPPTDTHPWLYNSIPPNPPTPNTTHILTPGLCLSPPSTPPPHNTQILTPGLSCSLPSIPPHWYRTWPAGRWRWCTGQIWRSLEIS